VLRNLAAADGVRRNRLEKRQLDAFDLRSRRASRIGRQIGALLDPIDIESADPPASLIVALHALPPTSILRLADQGAAVSAGRTACT
jgi:hypothetical protein